MTDLVIYSVGDLVKFVTPEIFNAAREAYANPGIIFGIREAAQTIGKSAYNVRWNDGRITTEYSCYLERLN